VKTSSFQNSISQACAMIAVGMVFAAAGAGNARAQDRIVHGIDNGQIATVKGNVHPQARAEFDQGPADSALRLQGLTILFKPTAAQQASVDSLLSAQQDRSSPNYHRWLTPEQFASLSGISQNDLNRIVSWLQSQGFQVGATSRSRTWVSFSGTAQQVEAAFHTAIHRFAVNGETHYANAAPPAVPAAFADLVLGVRGLHDFHPQAHARASVTPNPRFTSSVSGNHYLTPNDFATIYDLNPLYSAGINGTGQKIAVIGQTDIVMSDISTFRTVAGLPASNPQIVLVAGDPGTSNSDLAEADLDLEWSGAVAPNASIYYVNSSDAFTSLIYAVAQNTAPVISISYGLCEQQLSTSDAASLEQTARQANAQGITIVAPTGDSGAADCDTADPATKGLAVDFPASMPYVTAVGGTEFSEGSGTYWNATNTPSPNGGSAISYIPEIVWNDTVADQALSAGGGGGSALFTKPTWQTGSGVPADGQRDVPDVAIAASADHDGYLICSGGSCVTAEPAAAGVGWRKTDQTLNVIGGTSMGVPTFAGIVALINQQAGTPQGQGNINYVLYPLAAATPSAFHDITSGSNIVPCQAASTGCPTSGAAQIGYTAGAGYDLASGLGSIDAYNLVTAWTSVSSSSTGSSDGSSGDFQLVASPPKVTLAPNSTANSQVTLTAINGFTVSGTPGFTCAVPSTFTGVTCSIVAASAPNTWTVTIMAAANAALYAPSGENPWSREIPGGIAALLAIVLLSAVAGGQMDARQRCPGARVNAHVVQRPLLPLAGALTLLCLGMLAAGCGAAPKANTTSSGSTAATPNAAAVTVQGTANGISHSVQIAVTVN
jgi:subtilase family serine protease